LSKENSTGLKMKSMPLEHQKLTNQEINELICELSIEIHEIKESFLEQIQTTESYIHKLRRHFCPEDFYSVEVDGKDLNDLLMKTYGNINSSEPRRFNKQKSEDGLAETN
jgi:hypothetical protein